MCIPHAWGKTFKADRRKREKATKASTPFNKELLKPDPGFRDERHDAYIPEHKDKPLLSELFSIFN